MSQRRTASLRSWPHSCSRAARRGASRHGAGGPATSAAGADLAGHRASRVAGDHASRRRRETPEATETAKPKPYPVSLPAYFEREPDGGDLRLGTVRERTAAYTSYDASYRSGHLRVTGVLNIPTGKGPFPAVVLAHGYIDPAIYVSGQGMTRERGYLATQGFVAFHVDYRNHAGLRRRPAGRPPAAHRLRARRDQRRAGPAPLAAGAGRRRPHRPLRPVDGRRRGLQGARDRAGVRRAPRRRGRR